MQRKQLLISWMPVLFAIVIALALGAPHVGASAGATPPADSIDFQVPTSPATQTSTPSTPDARPAYCVTTATPHPQFDGVVPNEGKVARQIAHCADDGYEVDGATRTLRVAEYSFRTGAMVGSQVPRVENFAGLLFRDVRIPTGAHITSATLALKAWGWQTGAPVTIVIRGEKIAYASDFNSANPWPKDRPRTDASVEWTIEGLIDTGVLNAPDLAAVIEEIVAQPDWQPGNDLAILIDPSPDNYQFVDWQAFEFSQTSGATLAASYVVIPATSTPSPTATASPTFTASPTATATPTATASPTSQPSGILVVNTMDDERNSDGDCSLREAVQAANDGQSVDGCVVDGQVNEIRLAAGAYSLALPGGREDGNAIGDLDLRSDVALVGAGMGNTILDASGLDRMLHILPGAHVEIRDLTIRNGATTQIPYGETGGGNGEPGGGILNEGAARLLRVTLTANRAGAGSGCRASATGDAGGQGSYIVGGAGGAGGGVYNSGLMTLESCTITQNSAGSGGGSGCDAAGAGGDGGGVYNAGTLAISLSTLEQNAAGTGGTGLSSMVQPAGRGGMGGGLYNAGYVDISNTAIRANDGGQGGAALADSQTSGAGGAGGGIANERSLFVSSSTLSENRAGSSGSGLTGEPGGDGGAVSNSGNAQLTNCTLTGNVAGSSSSKPDDSGPNGLAGNGGGIENSGSIRLSSCTIADNATGTGIASTPGRGRGGGIHVTGPTIVDNTILGQNSAYAEGADCAGWIASQGNNLIQDTAGCTILGDLQNVIADQSPLLAPLEDNGGPTWTLIPAPGSPALDAGDCDSVLEPGIDQRGMTRPQGNGCDIGAVESADFRVTFMPVAAP